jgi:hypothetical protein
VSAIPTPVRAALGLLANAVDAARTLPDRAVELPVLAVSTALQFSLRAQQRYAELALRGDELIDRLHGPPDEPPAWATFDDAPAEPNGSGASSEPAEPAAADLSAAADVSDVSADPSAAADVSDVSADPSAAPDVSDVSAADPSAAPDDPDAEAPATPPEDIPIAAADTPAALVKSAAKQPRARKAPAKKAAAETPKSVRAPRQAEPSAFDRTDDE